MKLSWNCFTVLYSWWTCPFCECNAPIIVTFISKSLKLFLEAIIRIPLKVWFWVDFLTEGIELTYWASSEIFDLSEVRTGLFCNKVFSEIINSGHKKLLITPKNVCDLIGWEEYNVSHYALCDLNMTQGGSIPVKLQ